MASSSPRPILLALLLLCAAGFIAVQFIWPQYSPFVPSGDQRKRIWTDDGRTMLSGGPGKEDAFDITTFRLDPEDLAFGLGREKFHALIEPRFIPADDIPWLHDGMKVLVARAGGETKVYPIAVLSSHEVVNDTIGGHPIFAAY